MKAERELEAGLPPPLSSVKSSFLQRFIFTVTKSLLFRRPSQMNEGHTKDEGEGEKEPFDEDKGHTTADNEESCAKLWSIYVGEAERYDTALVESWKADMEGMLIFSGLFSASLTAFLIESYKSLQPDSGDLTVAAISQVSRQLVAISTGATVELEPPLQFSPTAASLVCNALWFFSLSLSLTCALLATLVEQWAREFLHKAEMRPSPTRRARIFSFLYFGLKRFHMHTVVDVIPSLLHGSLLLFFAGLVAFLVPINQIIMYLMVGALVVFLLLYSILTVLPVVYLDCPYRTPLSTPLWFILQRVLALFHKPTTLTTPITMTDAVVDAAFSNTEERDHRALQWTLDSLTDDVELLPFVESLPDVIFGTNDSLFLPLLGDIETPSPLVARICSFILGAQKLPASDPLATRRLTAGAKALWALCLMPNAWQYRFHIVGLPWPGVVDALRERSHAAVLLAIQYQEYRWAHHLLMTIRDLLDSDHSSVDFAPQVQPRIDRLMRLVVLCDDLFLRRPFIALPLGGVPPSPSHGPMQELKALMTELGNSLPNGQQLGRARQVIGDFCDSYDWSFNCVRCIGLVISRISSSMHAEEQIQVFELQGTCSMVIDQIGLNPPASPVDDIFISFPTELDKYTECGIYDTLAQISFRLFPLLSAVDQHRPSGYLRYLVHRKDHVSIYRTLASCDLPAFAASFGDLLFQKLRGTPFGAHVVHAITAVADCLDTSGGIDFIDMVLARQSEAQTTVHAEFILRKAKKLLGLKDLTDRLNMCQYSSRATTIPTLQDICDDEAFHPHHPLFIPADVDVRTIIWSLENQLHDRALICMADFLSAVTPFHARFSTSWLFIDFVDVSWFEVEPEIQYNVFNGILTYCRTFLPKLPAEDFATFEPGLWTSGVFMSWRARGGYNVDGITLPCLRLLQESLELYHTFNDTAGGEAMDTTHSKPLLAAVMKQIVAQEAEMTRPIALLEGVPDAAGEDLSTIVGQESP
ncbi:hypothetical protein FB45DRAFT_796426 [Roridomyces roridus]|uniref:DUF6535 domain-containing protein n=1 Tax=Roridomyces roridus TaxID=1738132 RepID=A0AAD7BL35_9AGAR|nr:hypothetical protein FB45DRAFT_796426 [Roridomyces roridus]